MEHSETADSAAAKTMARLLETAAGFCREAAGAMRSLDPASGSRCSHHAAAAVEEMAVGLDHEGGGDAVQNLGRIYEWWMHELMEAVEGNQPERLERIAGQMEELQRTWEEAGRRAQA